MITLPEGVGYGNAGSFGNGIGGVEPYFGQDMAYSDGGVYGYSNVQGNGYGFGFGWGFVTGAGYDLYPVCLVLRNI
jgi:hypothetical protein